MKCDDNAPVNLELVSQLSRPTDRGRERREIEELLLLEAILHDGAQASRVATPDRPQEPFGVSRKRQWTQ